MDLEVLKMADCLIVNETEASFYAGVEVTDGDMVRTHADRLRRLTEGTVIAVSYTHLGLCRMEKVVEQNDAVAVSSMMVALL